jgi:transposase
MNLTVSTKYVCGIDLHAREMRICVMDMNGQILLKRNIPCDIEVFISHVKPFMKSLTVGVESTFNWYWLLDKLKEHKITAALGHALYIKRMKGGKHKNDPVDARDIADLLRANRFPLAYDYPAEMRAVRDLLRPAASFYTQACCLVYTFPEYLYSTRPCGCRLRSCKNTRETKSIAGTGCK